MPIYEYICEMCEERLEVLQQISDPLLRECPACHKATLKKLVSAAGFRLAGQGWYETDFKTKNQRNLATAAEPKSDTTKDTTKTKDDSKASNSSTKKTTDVKSSTPATKPAQSSKP